MFHLSQLQSSLLLLSTILLYHIVMHIILLYYTALSNFERKYFVCLLRKNKVKPYLWTEKHSMW